VDELTADNRKEETKRQLVILKRITRGGLSGLFKAAGSSREQQASSEQSSEQRAVDARVVATCNNVDGRWVD
jgi:hypothetical protein